ncbi:MAG: hypothetical protein LBI93_05345 [Endomicrobium sp.]|nr:hypothetical protein [Endomicrobium sp.]
MDNLQKYERLEGSSNAYIADNANKDIEKIDKKLKGLLDLRLENELTQ